MQSFCLQHARGEARVMTRPWGKGRVVTYTFVINYTFSLTYIINVKQFCVKYKIINDDNYFMLGMHIY